MKISNIEVFPVSEDGHNAIFVVVDTDDSHFAPFRSAYHICIKLRNRSVYLFLVLAGWSLQKFL